METIYPSGGDDGPIITEALKRGDVRARGGTFFVATPIDLSTAAGRIVMDYADAPNGCLFVGAASRTETATDPGGALDNPSAPRIVEGMRCPGCKRKHTVEVVYGSVSHAGKTWARVVYTCVCCEWHDVRGQK